MQVTLKGMRRPARTLEGRRRICPRPIDPNDSYPRVIHSNALVVVVDEAAVHPEVAVGSHRRPVHPRAPGRHEPRRARRAPEWKLVRLARKVPEREQRPERPRPEQPRRGLRLPAERDRDAGGWPRP
ncbi:hypothetical protein SEVIR_2G411850v4 [Setaria viridis]